MKEFKTLDALLACLEYLGAKRVYCKFLAENDNTKQQIYLGKNFDVLKLLKFGSIRTEPGGKRPNFKATFFLSALESGKVIYDPAPKLTGASTGNAHVKARSQFRMNINEIHLLYQKLDSVNL
ncbi:MAG: hypothetical protein ACHP7O_08570 [Burkholderiales bacterium]